MRKTFAAGCRDFFDRMSTLKLTNTNPLQFLFPLNQHTTARNLFYLSPWSKLWGHIKAINLWQFQIASPPKKVCAKFLG